MVGAGTQRHTFLSHDQAGLHLPVSYEDVWRTAKSAWPETVNPEPKPRERKGKPPPESAWMSGLAEIRTLAREHQSFRDADSDISGVLPELEVILAATAAAAPIEARDTDDYAEIQNLHGNVLYALSNLGSDLNAAAKAVSAYRKALAIWTARGEVAARVRVELNLANALTKMAEDASLSPEEQEKAGSEALEILPASIAALPDHDPVGDWHRAHVLLGNALMAAGSTDTRLEDAAKAYEQAARPRYRKVDPIGWAFCQSAYSTALYELGRYTEALKACDQAQLVLSPNSLHWSEAEYNRASALRKRGEPGDLAEAVNAYARALEGLPAKGQLWGFAHYGRGLALEGLGEWRSALNDFLLARDAIEALGPKAGAAIQTAVQSSFQKAAAQQAASKLLADARVAGISTNITDLDRELLIAVSTWFNLELGVDKQNKIVSSFDRFLDTIGIQAPEVRQSLSAQVLPLIEAVTAPNPTQIQWPKERYQDAHRRRGVNIVQFLEDENVGWIQLIRARLVDLRTLRSQDAKAASALNDYKRRGGAVPDHIRLPTLKESNDAALASNWIKSEDISRLERASRRRKLTRS